MVKHLSRGGGAPIHTSSGYTDWSTSNGGKAPEYHKGEYPADRITHKHPAPKGEKPRRYDDATPAQYSQSGSQLPFGPGKHEAPNVETKKGAYAKLDRGVPRGIPDRDRFNQGFGSIGCGEGGSAKGDKGVAYKDGEGRTKYRGRSG